MATTFAFNMYKDFLLLSVLSTDLSENETSLKNSPKSPSQPISCKIRQFVQNVLQIIYKELSNTEIFPQEKGYLEQICWFILYS